MCQPINATSFPVVVFTNFFVNRTSYFIIIFFLVLFTSFGSFSLAICLSVSQSPPAPVVYFPFIFIYVSFPSSVLSTSPSSFLLLFLLSSFFSLFIDLDWLSHSQHLSSIFQSFLFTLVFPAVSYHHPRHVPFYSLISSARHFLSSTTARHLFSYLSLPAVVFLSFRCVSGLVNISNRCFH